MELREWVCKPDLEGASAMGSVVIAAHSDFEAVDCRTRDSKTRVRTYDGQNSSTSVAIENFNCRDRKKWLTPDNLNVDAYIGN